MIRDFKISELFEVATTKSVDKNKIIFSSDGKYDFIGRSSENYGIQGRMNKLEYAPNPKDTFSLVQVGASICLYRENEWYASQNIFILVPRTPLICQVHLYFEAVINKYLARHYSAAYTYPKKDDVKNILLRLPVIHCGDKTHEYTFDDIDYEYMKERIAELERERIAELNAYLVASGLDNYELTDEDKEILSLSPKSSSDEEGPSEIDSDDGQIIFKKFKVGDVFDKVEAKCKKKDFDKRRDTSTAPTDEYCIPLVNAKVGDNGIMFYGRKHDWNTQAMCIDVIQNGAIATGTVYAQPQPVGVLWDAYLIKTVAEVKSVEALLYLAKCIEKITKGQFSYDKKATWDRVKCCEISLPVTSDGGINFDYMERYIRAIEKLEIKDVVAYKAKRISSTKQLVKG